MKILIKNGRVIDPANKIDTVADVLAEGGKIIYVGASAECPPDAEANAELIDATGLWVTPGLIDMHVHLREPGQTHKETIATGTRAAAAGGFTTVCCMPNTSPAIHNAEIVQLINNAAMRDGVIRVLPVGSITKDLAGAELSALKEMKAAGICAISDDGKTVENSAILAQAMTLAKSLDLPVLSHCEPEEEIIGRDIELAKETGARLHICHVSTAAGVELIRAARAERQITQATQITAEAAPHHFTLVAEDITHNGSPDPNFKMAPPLRSRADRSAILAALKDGTISVIATDHAPHHENEKNVPYPAAANGIIGLETAVPLAISELVETGILTPLELIAKLTINPANILNLHGLGRLTSGGPADITIIDPAARHVIDKNSFAGLSKNTPFHGRAVTGRVLYTIYNGKIVYQGGEFSC